MDSISTDDFHKLLAMKDHHGDTVVNLAAFNGQTEILKQAIDLVKTEELLELLNIENKDDNTVLICAAYKGHSEILKCIVV